MACKTSYDLHHNFPRLAEETGFAFNTHRPRVHIDWNKIRLIDIESLARDRKFVLIEQHVNDILDCVLESEFDVRILDEGVVKLFRLAQLAVEYQQFCRHYLDRSVFVLRQEIDALAQDLAVSKKELQEKDEELRKLRRKGKHGYRPLISYGNDNIATMILKSLTNKGDMFPSITNGEVPHYNKCNYCDKVFLNQLYLKSHISRRHVNMLDEVPQREEKEMEQSKVINSNHENNKLNVEINELKQKIKDMEIFITTTNKIETKSEETKTNDRVDNKEEMKNVEVSTNNEQVFEKLEEWKKAEQENHTKEINLLRNQLFETLNSFRMKEDKKNDETVLIEQLHVTIRKQGAEILALKQALTHSELKSDNEDKERKKEVAEKMLTWAKRDEDQSKQYELLLQKLNEVVKEARESRAIAEMESQRAGKLETLLNERLNYRKPNISNSTDTDAGSSSQEYKNTGKKDVAKINIKAKPMVDHSTIEKLHRKAQELLNMKSSSSSSESINNQQAPSPTKTIPARNNTKQQDIKNYYSQPEDDLTLKKTNQDTSNSKSFLKPYHTKITHQKKKRIRKEPSESSPIIALDNGPIPGSPLKVVRAKITEEVNSRLVQAGVDPLKSRLQQSVFQKQKAQLQQQLDLKTKKYPAYEQVRYTIMAYLDSGASEARRDVNLEENITSPNSLTKPFSLSSMISNVKSKALSLVKSKETKFKSHHKIKSSEVVKKASSLLKTPPGSPVGTNDRYHSPNYKVSHPVRDINLDSVQHTESAVLDRNKKNKTGLVNRRKTSLSPVDDVESDSNGSNSPYNVAIPQRPSQSIDTLIKTSARRPSSANADYSNAVLQYVIGNNNNDHLSRTQSVIDISEFVTYRSDQKDERIAELEKSSNDDIQALINVNKPNNAEDNNRNSPKQTKGVLKNASSTSSLNKKKVIFDMDAIQMKSISASPSQSLTEKSDDKYDLGLDNIGNDEWDISSIENEPIRNDTKIRVKTGQSLKIAELKQTIEAQLARRSETPSSALFGVDILKGPIPKAFNMAGSNTSLGSSILDDSDSTKVLNQKTVIKPKKISEKDDSELDISDFSIDGVTNKNEKDSF